MVTPIVDDEPCAPLQDRTLWTTHTWKHAASLAKRSTRMDEAPAIEVDEAASAATPEESEAQLALERQAIMQGLSRLERTVDDSGYAFTALDAVDKGLISIASLREYPHLQFVNVAHNGISDMTALTELPYLVCANVSENALATPTAFANAYLQSLDLSLNQLTTLQGLTSASLTSLCVSDNQLESLAGLGGMPSLTILDAARNAVADLAALADAGNTKLERLDLSENKLLNLAGIEALPSLNSLSLCQNNLDSMEVIEKLTTLENLSELDLSLNPVTDSENYRLSMIVLLPHVKKLDGELVTDDERLAAVDLKQQRMADDAAAAMAEADL